MGRFGVRQHILLATLALFLGVGAVFVVQNATKTEAAVGINKQISFQGKVTNSSKLNVADGTYQFVFRFYTVGSGGSAVWTETVNLPVADGIFQHNLGSVTPLPGSVDFNSDNIFLGITFNSDPAGEMSPRIQLTASPYAFNADQLDGLDATDFVQISPSAAQTGDIAITGSVSAGSMALSDGSSNFANIVVDSLASDYTFTIPTVAANDTFCLENLGNCSGGSGSIVIGALNGGTPSADGASFSSGALYLQTASVSNPGLVSTSSQTFGGLKTFNNGIDVVGVAEVDTLKIETGYGIAKIGHYGTISETHGGLAYITGNNIAADNLLNNTVTKTTSAADGAQFMRMRYDQGISFHTGIGIGDPVGTSYVDTTNQRLTITNTGNVGIGNSSPSSLLTVGPTGAFKVDGSGNIITSGALTVGGLGVFDGGLHVATGQNFTVNGDVFTDLTGAGLIVSGGALQAILGSSVDLTSEITGILPVANGGTGTGTAFTQGSIVFAGATGAYNQNNANFFWDNTNARLGLGANSSLGAKLTFGASTTAAGGIDFGGDANLYRNAAGSIRTDGTFHALQLVAGSGIVGSAVITARDNAAGTTNIIWIRRDQNNAGAVIRMQGAAAQTLTSPIMTSNVSGDGYSRFQVQWGGGLQWGDGATSPDILLSRGAANRLDLASGDSLNLAGASGDLLTNDVVRLSSSGVLTNVTYNGNAITASYGGTGQTSYTTGDLLYASSSSTLSKLAIGTSKQCLTVTGGLPVWGGCGPGSVTYLVAASDSPAHMRAAADYLADGTSDEDEINTALTAGAGGKIYLAEGTYVADGTILIPNNTTLEGAGMSTVVRLAIGTSDNLVENSDVGSGTGIVVRNMTLDGQSSLNGGTQYGIYLEGMGDSASYRIGATIENVHAHSFVTNAIYLNNSDNNTIVSSKIRNNWYGIYLLDSNSNTISNNEALNNGHTGIFLSGSSNNVISGNTANHSSSAAGTGISLGSSSNNNTVSGNTANYNHFGIRASGSSGNTITGNTASFNGSEVGISLVNVTNHTVTGNAVSNNRVGIAVQGSSHNSISDNTVTLNYETGIRLNLSADNNIVSGNRLHDNGEALDYHGIEISSSDNNQVTSNKITDTAGTGYAIRIHNFTSENNYLSDNTFSGTGASSISNTGTGTVYGVQQDGSGGMLITGNLLPSVNDTYDLGSDTARWKDLWLGGDTIHIGANTGDEATVSYSAATDSLVFKNATNSAAAWQVQDSSGTTLVAANTSNRSLEVYGDVYSKGLVWTGRTAASANSWTSVAYGNGLFVAVSAGGSNPVMTSEDGINWISRAGTEGSSNWTSVTYGNGLFVAVGLGGPKVMTSPDGITWTNRYSQGQWTSVTYGNGLFVAVANSGTERVLTSADGINWTSYAAAEANEWTSVTYGNGLFVAVSQTGTNRIMTSADGINWTSYAAAEANAWQSVTYGNGLFVAVSHTGTNRVMTSPNGSTWTVRTPPDTRSWRSVTYGNGLFVAVACGITLSSCDSTAGTRIMTSPDGISWTPRLAPQSNSWRSVTYGNGLFVAVSQSGTDRVMTSGKAELMVAPHHNIYYGGMNINGTTSIASGGSPVNSWVAQSVTARAWSSITYGNGTFVALACGSTTVCNTTATQKVMTSTDGTTWTAVAESSNSQWQSITYGNGLFVAVAQVGTNQIMTSPDGVTWTTRTTPAARGWHSVAYGNGKFVAVACAATANATCNTTSATRAMYSVDGITWVMGTTISPTNNWQSVTYGNGKFVAVSAQGNVATSSDGITWTNNLAGLANTFESVTYGNGLFVAVGNGSSIYTSPDGVTWSSVPLSETNTWQSVVYGAGQFVAVASTGSNRIMTSTDGISWTLRSAAEANPWQDVAYGDGRFVAVSLSGTNRSMVTQKNLALRVEGNSEFASNIKVTGLATFDAKDAVQSLSKDTLGTGTYTQTAVGGATVVSWSVTSSADLYTVNASAGATAGLGTPFDLSTEVLIGKGYNLAVPTSANITDVQLCVVARHIGTNLNFLDSLTLDGTTAVGYTMRNASATFTSSFAEHCWSKGSSFTPAQVNSSTFGAMVYIEGPSSVSEAFFLDALYLRVAYTTAAESPKYNLGVNAANSGFGISASSALYGELNALTILHNGNIGIGTANPLHQLTIGQGETPAAVGQLGIYNDGTAFLTVRHTSADVEGYFGATALDNSIFIGSATNHALTFRTNNTVKMVLTSSGDFGIGTVNPGGYKLKVETGTVGFRLASDMNLHFGYTGSVVSIEAFNDANTVKRDIMLAGYGGNVGIGTSTPAQKLQVQGNIRVGTSGSNGCIQGFGGATLTGTCASDVTLKTDIHDLGDALTSIGNIDFVTYKWNQTAGTIYKNDTSITNYGTIAQSVGAALPGLVTPNENGHLEVNYSALLVYGLQATKQLKVITDTHEVRLTGVEQQVELLSAMAEGYATSGSVQTLTSSLAQRVASLESGTFAGGITVAGPAVFNSTLTVMGDTFVQNITVGGKFITAGALPQAVLAATTPADAAVTVVGNDTAGEITFIASEVPVSGQQFALTFTAPFGAKPRVNMTPVSAAAAQTKYFIEATATGFTVSFIDPPQPGETYGFSYFAVQ